LSSFRIKDVNGVKSSSTYRQLFAQNPKGVDLSKLTLLQQPYLNLINVYENEDIWRIQNRYFNNEAGDDMGIFVMPLPEEKRLKHDVPAICLGGNETFQRNWKLFTECTFVSYCK
jgi:hypothetical protein